MPGHSQGKTEKINPTRRIHNMTFAREIHKFVAQLPWEQILLIVIPFEPCPNEPQQFHPHKLFMAQQLLEFADPKENVPTVARGSVVYDGWM